MDNPNTSTHTKYYNSKGTLVPNVTSIISLLDKGQGLIQWAYTLGLERKPNPNTIKNNAAVVGTFAHLFAECYATSDMSRLEKRLQDTTLKDEDRQQIHTAALRWVEFTKTHTLEPKLLEQKFVSEKYQFGGTIDIYGMLDGKYSIVDIKTSKAIYLEHKIQVAAYSLLVNEHNHPIEQVAIVRIGKEDNDALEILYIKEEELLILKQLFLSILNVHSIKKEYESHVKKQNKEKGNVRTK